jgi:two-component system chemotaxis response regulator CheB
MPGRDIIVIGGSAGAIPVLNQIVGALPADLPAAVFVVIHSSPHHESHLAAILSRAGPLPAREAQDGEPVLPGRIYIARADHHLLLHDGQVLVRRGPRENRFRPAIDPLFRSAARDYRSRVVGVLLSGQLSDGVMGLMAIRMQGGLALVQAPGDATYPSMPQTALEHGAVDQALPGPEIGPALVQLTARPASGDSLMADIEDRATLVIERDFEEQEADERDGEPAVVTCPDCGGTLWQNRAGSFIQFRCHVGHRYALDALMLEQSEALERALWTCMRMLKEKTALSRQMAHRYREQGDLDHAVQVEENGRVDEESVGIIQQLIHMAVGSNLDTISMAANVPVSADD